jgi:hypothetical protein
MLDFRMVPAPPWITMAVGAVEFGSAITVQHRMGNDGCMIG